MIVRLAMSLSLRTTAKLTLFPNLSLTAIRASCDDTALQKESFIPVPGVITFKTADDPRCLPARFGTRFRRRLRPAQVQRRIDDADVAEGLREVAEHAACARVVLLGQEANVIAQAGKAIV
jgi:hypothetical protein